MTMASSSGSRRRWWRRWWPVQLTLACLILPWAAAAGGSSAAVTRLPGFDGPLPFSLETGYVEVDQSTGVHLFYYFIQSEKDPDRDPLLLWLTGGPGCSSISGLTHEIGPVQFAEQFRGPLPRLIYRPETWTKVSNIIFVDSPAGTGFSYATTEEGLNSSDTTQVKHLLVFLRKWLQDHPRFLLNPLYISGDSYSGITVPTLSLEIDKSNDLGEEPRLNLKGYIGGNPFTDLQFDADGTIPFLHGMGLISDELYQHAKESCGGKYSSPSNALCSEAIQAIENCTKDINLSHVLEPLCEEVWSPRIHKTAATDGTSRLRLLESARHDELTAFDCRKASYALLKIWANDKTVRQSLGVHKGTVGDWKRCNYDINYTRNVGSSLDYHLGLMRKGYRAIIYSGDHDAKVSNVGTQAWIRFLNLSIVDDWRPWYVAGQVAGFTRNYASILTYATVKGAGHTAPEYKPKQCFEMFQRWISGNPL